MPARRAIQNRRLLGKRVAQVRRSRGWTHEGLAEKLGVSVRYLQAVEAGQENLTLDSLTQLALRLELSLGELVDQVFVLPRRLPTRMSTSDDDGSTLSRAADASPAHPANEKARATPKRPTPRKRLRK